MSHFCWNALLPDHLAFSVAPFGRPNLLRYLYCDKKGIKMLPSGDGFLLVSNLDASATPQVADPPRVVGDVLRPTKCKSNASLRPHVHFDSLFIIFFFCLMDVRWEEKGRWKFPQVCVGRHQTGSHNLALAAPTFSTSLQTFFWICVFLPISS